MSQDKCWAEFKLTDISKGLPIKDVQKAAFTLFTIPLKIPKEQLKFMSLEEFIIEGYKKDER